MTQEEKQLLLKDLCARLPYGVIVQFEGWNPEKLSEVNLNTNVYNDMGGLPLPYLRPMSSMSSEEWVEFCDCSIKDEASWVITKNRQKLFPTQNREDYLNSKHFDYRGLIEKGLALEAKEGMYKNE